LEEKNLRHSSLDPCFNRSYHAPADSSTICEIRKQGTLSRMSNTIAPTFTRKEAEALVASRPWWYHRFEIFPGVITPGVYDPSSTLGGLGLPVDLRGQRILEIGPADGFFTKQLTIHGAVVTALDYCARDFCGFAIMEKLHGARFEFVQGNIYDLPQFGFQPFDLVLCLGVLYHMPDMVRALYMLRGVCGDRLIIETLIATDLGDEPRARYHPAASLNNDPTNFWSPNIACVQAMLTDVGFIVESSRIFSQNENSGRAAFWCRANTSAMATNKTDLAYLHTHA
jgi:tRNA (mo5U34)-methyltransferase